MNSGKNDLRKLQVTGGSTIIVSLPKDWVNANDLGKGDFVNLEELASGDLRLSSIQSRTTKKVSQIDCCNHMVGLRDLMIGSYLSGADVIKISCKDKIPRKTLGITGKFQVMVRIILVNPRNYEEVPSDY